MNLQDIAMRAAAAITNSINHSNDHGVRFELRERRARIQDRFRIVYLCDAYRWARAEESVEFDGRWYTPASCTSCSECEDAVPLHLCRSIQFQRRYSGTVCESCADNLDTWYCECCDTTFSGSVSSYDADGEPYCRSCYETWEGQQEQIPSYHGAKRWSFDPSKPSYSFELELVANDRSGLIKLLSSLNLEKVSWEQDGSLPRDTGLEILIQHRSTLQALAADTCALTDAIKNKGYGISAWNFRSGEGESGAGMHLNSNRHAKWTRHKLMRLIYVVMKCKDLLVRIAGRESEQWAPWPLSAKEGGSRELLYRWAGESFGKYLCLRIGYDRMEWRMFRSTLDSTRIDIYCETVSIIEEWALGDCSAHQLANGASDALNLMLSCTGKSI